MYTRATKDFGIWRENHNIRRRFAGRPTSGFVMALSVAALVSWLAFILVWKIRGDFYLIDSAMVPIPTFSGQSKLLYSQRPAAVSIAVLTSARARSEVTVLFDTGRVFQFPSQESEMSRYLEERVDSLEYTSMLTMNVGVGVSRVQVWPDRKIGHGTLNAILRIFAQKGFDDFDIAVLSGNHS